MSFINLLENTIWSDNDITNRTESMVHSRFSISEETILNRKVTGAQLGYWELSQEEQAQLIEYSNICNIAHSEGISARYDNNLLKKIIEYENAQKVLLQNELTEDDRNIAETIINTATEEILTWVNKRNPQINE